MTDAAVNWFEQRSRLSGSRTAVVDGETGERWTYSEMETRAAGIAAFLRKRGVSAGDRVGLLSPNDVAYLDLLMACRKVGAIFVPLNWRLAAGEISGILQDCIPKIIVIHPDLQAMAVQVRLHSAQTVLLNDTDYAEALHSGETLAAAVPSSIQDAWMMIYTGGTTGKPKGVVLSHESVLWNAINTVLSWSLSQQDSTPTYLPMFHTGGLNALSLPVLLAGGTVVIARSFDADSVVRLLNEERCTIALMVPTMYHMLVASDAFQQAEFPTMHTFISGGAPCPQAVYSAFARKNLAFKEGYGATESGPNNFYIDPHDVVGKPGSVGTAMMFNEVRIVGPNGEEKARGEVGEIVLSGRHLFQQYWNQPEATQEVYRDGWFHTGDLGKRDEDGYYYIVGRQKDMIITGGENVYPLEIEHLLQSHPYVREAAVIGLPDEKWGEIVVAVIAAYTGTELDESGLKAFCKERIAKYKIPKQMLFVHELPKTPVGKLDKKSLFTLF